jgi:hypothetical protein
MKPIVFVCIYDTLSYNCGSVNRQIVGGVENGDRSNICFGFASIEVAHIECGCGEKCIGANAPCNAVKGMVKCIVIECDFLTDATT